MKFERGSPSAFFAPSERQKEILAERAHCLATEPEICTAMTEIGAPSMWESIELASSWRTLPENFGIESISTLTALQQCRWLCENWECDFLILVPDSAGVFRLQGGALCFPSHWDLLSKMGCTVAEIHEPVPQLNSKLGRSIDGFLSKMKEGISWERINWGLSPSYELNQHPSRGLPKLDETVEIGDVWWRLEEQSLVSLPNSGGVLFGIRVTVHPLSSLLECPAALNGLTQALSTMPEQMAIYKGIASARNRIIEILSV